MARALYGNRMPGDEWQKAANNRLLLGHRLDSPARKHALWGASLPRMKNGITINRSAGSCWTAPLTRDGKFARPLPRTRCKRRCPTASVCFPGAGKRYLMRVSNHIGTNFVTELTAYVLH